MAAAAAKAIGVRWDPRWAPEEAPEIARWVEELGYDELWMVEDCFSTGGLTMASVALASTERLAVGVGLLPAAVRNPAIAAMEIGALARLFPGRFMPAFGHGVGAWMDQIDARPEGRLTLLEETVSAVRSLVRGDRLDRQGRFVNLSEVELEHRPQQSPPILVGTTGPRGLALAGRVADGIVIPEVATPGAVSWARGLAAASGGPGRTVVYSYLSLDRDDAAGIAAAQPLVGRWMSSGVFPDMAERAGLGRDGAAELDETTLRSIAVAGDPASGARTVRGLWDAGADAVVVLPRGGDAREQLRLFADEVVPELRA